MFAKELLLYDLYAIGNHKGYTEIETPGGDSNWENIKIPDNRPRCYGRAVKKKLETPPFVRTSTIKTLF